jgi:hypothetical protein
MRRAFALTACAAPAGGADAPSCRYLCPRQVPSFALRGKVMDPSEVPMLPYNPYLDLDRFCLADRRLARGSLRPPALSSRQAAALVLLSHEGWSKDRKVCGVSVG